MSLFDKTTESLGASLNFRLARQDVVSSNIANAETPGYHSKILDFEGELARALDLDGLRKLDTTHEKHMPTTKERIGQVKSEIYDDPDIPIDNDRNTVDLEKEMAKLAENSILYKAAVELINKKFGSMKYAVGEGGGR